MAGDQHAPEDGELVGWERVLRSSMWPNCMWGGGGDTAWLPWVEGEPSQKSALERAEPTQTPVHAMAFHEAYLQWRALGHPARCCGKGGEQDPGPAPVAYI